MAHDLFRQYGNQPAPNDGGFSQLAGNINRFVDEYNGNPYAEAEGMIRSGEITREQWNEALRMARQIRPHLGRK